MGWFSRVILLLAVAGLSACQPRGEDDAIFTAVLKNDAEAVRIYLFEGGDANAISAHGDPLLFIATGPRGGEEVTELLLQEGANPNAQSAEGRTVLQNAAGWCDVSMVTILLSYGADPSLTGADGLTAADAACKAPEDRRAATLRVLEGN